MFCSYVHCQTHTRARKTYDMDAAITSLFLVAGALNSAAGTRLGSHNFPCAQQHAMKLSTHAELQAHLLSLPFVLAHVDLNCIHKCTQEQAQRTAQVHNIIKLGVCS